MDYRRPALYHRRFEASAIPSLSMEFTAHTFRPRIGDVFQFELGEGGELELELVEVEEGGLEATEAAKAAGLREPFSILFRGPLEPLLPQGTYSVKQKQVGAFPLFIVPISQDEADTRYQAVFG
jgi:uncharacterized protein DUF6916